MPTEKTFRSYSQEQGKAYAQARQDYHPKVYQTVVDLHTSTGGQLNTLIDVGCGPGLAARGLAGYFAHVTGIDPSEGMIATARSLGGETSASEPIRYELSTAEELGSNLGEPVGDASVDLITASNAAHWFDMPAFWARAAQVLKPGGTVTLWTSGEIRIHPSMPNAAAAQAAMDRYSTVTLKAYYDPGNAMVREGYAHLPLPWNITPAVLGFDESAFIRKEWAPGSAFFVGLGEGNMDLFEKVMATGSPYTRWSEAHPADAGTERDVLRMLRREIEGLLQESGVEKGQEMIKADVQGVILMVKKRQ